MTKKRKVEIELSKHCVRRFRMTEKRFERIYADVNVFCRDHNAKEGNQLIGREDYDRIVDLLNEQHEQIERLKQNFKALDEVKCELAEENEQLKKRCSEYWEEAGLNNDYYD